MKQTDAMKQAAFEGLMREHGFQYLERLPTTDILSTSALGTGQITWLSMVPWKAPIKSRHISATGCRSSSSFRMAAPLAPATIPAPSGRSTRSGKSSGAPDMNCKEGRYE